LIKAEARSSHDEGVWSAWESAENGVPLTETPEGRYVEIRVTLQSFTGEQSPLLYDLTVRPAVAAVESVRRCFIATAAYDTPMADEIRILRAFRDEYLLTSLPGQTLAGLYYTVSPPIAEFIAAHPGLKPVVRAGLVPAVAISAVAVTTTPAQKMAMVGLLVLISLVLAVWATRWRGRGPEYTGR